MLTALIVDDEPLAREELRLLLEQAGNIRLLGECAHAMEALPAIHRLKPDLLFLDIQMPRISGLELVSMLDPDLRPHIVFITAYDEFALRAFEENALDYLLKPVTAERMNKALERIQRLLSPLSSKGGELTGQPLPDPTRIAQPLRSIPCSGHNRILLLPLGEVEFVHSDLAGNKVVSAQQQGTTELTLRTLEEKTGFVRCHRQYLLNPGQIREILLLDGGLAEVVTQGGHKVPVSRRYLKPLKELLEIP
ncbi:two-component system response regulator BtsR [Aeromonas hydrophila]|uniref:two-component system response regulator BtsR n=1 Tax=Aeromonas hydrophila TaxID=644 RepID=UPI002B46E708|nr:two-component system response regulator BtsR [Aeromonas hydrophila]